MDFLFSQLKQKDVISLSDGKNLGRVCDMTFSFPEKKVLGITVTGAKGFKFVKQEQFIPMDAVVKIGEDSILVKLVSPPPDCPPKKKPKCPPDFCPPPPPDRRNYDEYE